MSVGVKGFSRRALSGHSFSYPGMPLKAVIFDAPVIIGRLTPPTGADIEKMAEEAQSEMKTLSHAILGTSSAPIRTEPEPSPIPQPPTDAPLPPSVRYAEKIRLKAAQRSVTATLAATGGGFSAITGAGTSSRWMLASPGIGQVLDYLAQRGLKLGVLGNPDMTSSRHWNTFRTQLGNSTPLSYVRPDYDRENILKQAVKLGLNTPSTDREFISTWSSAALNQCITELNISPREVLVISGNEGTLVYAKDKGYRTCRYR